jgi:hypothetical protein
MSLINLLVYAASDPARYCSSLTFSIHSTTLPLTCAVRLEVGSYFLLFKTAVSTSAALSDSLSPTSAASTEMKSRI